jgi:hypothetical protein
MLGFSVDPDDVRERAAEYDERGYPAQKWFFRHGPGSGRDGIEKNVGLVEEEREGLLKVSAGFDSEGSHTLVRVEPAGVDALGSDPAYDSTGSETTGDEPRVDLLVAGVLGFAVVVLFLPPAGELGSA